VLVRLEDLMHCDLELLVNLLDLYSGISQYSDRLWTG
jgi:hypothetical protein